jgi:hypothetical protein
MLAEVMQSVLLAYCAEMLALHEIFMDTFLNPTIIILNCGLEK